MTHEQLGQLVEFRRNLGGRKPTVPEVLPFFVPYVAKHLAWGSLHIVLDDINLEDHSVRSCIDWAREDGDEYGEQLALILLHMSRTQRRKVGVQAGKIERDNWNARIRQQK